MKTPKNVSGGLAVLSLALGLMGPMAVHAAGPVAVDLLSAGNFVILAKTGISNTGSTSVVGDIGVSPAAATYITGFGLNLPASSAFSTSALVTGKVYAPGYADPTSANITTAVSAMETAYTNGAGRTNPTATELGAGNIGGLTIAPGLYKWSTGLAIPTDVTLSGSANDVWIFQIAQNLNLSSAAKINLSGGAQASNIFWIVAGQTTIGTTAVFNGNILDQTAIVLNTGARLNGRALSQTAVTLDSNAVTMPTASAPATPATPATPITPATPAVPTATPVVPVTPATPAASFIAPVIPVPASVNTTDNVETTAILPTVSDFGQQVKAIAKNLAKGIRSSKVTTLQKFLISQDNGPAARALAKHGVTTFFGVLTRTALTEFQASVGIKPASGKFDAKTRAYLKVQF